MKPGPRRLNETEEDVLQSFATLTKTRPRWGAFQPIRQTVLSSEIGLPRPDAVGEISTTPGL